MATEKILGIDLKKDAPYDRRIQVADETERLALKWVYKGLLVYQVDADDYYKCDVTTRTQGSSPWTIIADWSIFVGATGAAGADGSVWYNGGADPAGGTGQIGDYFLQTADGSSFVKGDIHEKTGASTWTLRVNLMGADGLDASAGEYGDLFVNDNSAGTPQVSGSALTDYAKITQWDDTTLAQGLVPNPSTDIITSTNGGKFAIEVQISASGGVGSYRIMLFKNGVSVDRYASEGKIDLASSKVNLKIAGVLDLIASDYVEVQFSGQAAANFLILEGSFVMYSIGAAGASGAPGETLTVDEGDVTFSDSERTTIEAGGATDADRWVITVFNDTRTGPERTAGPAEIIDSLTNKMVAWNGTTWYIYGTWRGPQGITGLTGPAGTDGIVGSNGTDGAAWWCAAVAPTTQGVDGDFFLNTATGDIYKKLGGTWGTPTMNIKGTDGSDGAVGAQGNTGATGPAGVGETVKRWVNPSPSEVSGGTQYAYGSTSPGDDQVPVLYSNQSHYALVCDPFTVNAGIHKILIAWWVYANIAGRYVTITLQVQSGSNWVNTGQILKMPLPLPAAQNHVSPMDACMVASLGATTYRIKVDLEPDPTSSPGDAQNRCILDTSWTGVIISPLS